MKILVTGSSGLVGSHVVRHLTGAGHFVVRLVRSEPNRGRGDLLWDPVSGRIERNKMEDIDAVVHLAGASLFGLWTAARRQLIYSSRVTATEFLCETLAGLQHRPKVLLAASAIGYYGERGDQWLNEHSSPGLGFLPELCQDWERATGLAAHAGIRVANLRFGIVLSTAGGALKQMLPMFKLGLGGAIGSGRHYQSWISVDDAVGAVSHVMATASIEGAVNVVAPDPATNRDFTRALARVLHRPACLPIPSPLLKLLPGGMGRELILASARVAPDRLTQSGFRFGHSDLEGALQHLVTGP
jgi:hypothetical protein